LPPLLFHSCQINPGPDREIADRLKYFEGRKKKEMVRTMRNFQKFMLIQARYFRLLARWTGRPICLLVTEYGARFHDRYYSKHLKGEL